MRRSTSSCSLLPPSDEDGRASSGDIDPTISTIWRFNGTAFVEFQAVETAGANAWCAFEIDGQHFLAVANSHDGLLNASSPVNSTVLRYDGRRFVTHQQIPTYMGLDIESFRIDDETYLAIANTESKAEGFSVKSPVLKWSREQARFMPFQLLTTSAATGVTHFAIGGTDFLAVANRYGRTGHRERSPIFRWRQGKGFELFQTIQTKGAYDWEFFTIGSSHFLALANHWDEEAPNRKHPIDIDSVVYIYNGTSYGFVHYQSLATVGAEQWRHFTIGASHYLALAQCVDSGAGGTASPNASEKLYRWVPAKSDDDGSLRLSPWLEMRGGAAADPLGLLDPPEVPEANHFRLSVDCNQGSDSVGALNLSMGATVTQLSNMGPLKTLHAARDLLRAARASMSGALGVGAKMPGAVVTIRGVCHLTEPLLLSAEDSATAWVASGAGATISGGRKVERWVAAGWSTKPEVVRADAPWLASLGDVPLLRFGAGWVPRSRFPKKPESASNGSAGWLTVPADATDVAPANLSEWKYEDGVTVRIGLDPAVARQVGLSEELRDGGSMVVNMWEEGGERDVANQLGRVVGVNVSAARQPELLARFFSCNPGHCATTNPRYFIENVRAALAPGEFYFNRTSKQLFVWPLANWTAGAHRAGDSFVVPTLDRLVSINGSSGVSFSNISFADTTYRASGGDGELDGPAGDPSDAAVRINHASAVDITGCHFGAGIGGYAVAVGNRSVGVRVQGCLIEDVGQGGVIMYGAGTPVHDPSHAVDNRPRDAVVSHNLFRRIGYVLKSVAAVLMKSAHGCVIAHNAIIDSPRAAIELDTTNMDLGPYYTPHVSRDNLVQHNVIRGACLEANDCGAIYAYGGGFPDKMRWDLNNSFNFNNSEVVMLSRFVFCTSR